MLKLAGPGLDEPLTTLTGVGEARAALLERLGLRTVGDLLLHAPRRYEDRTHKKAIHDLVLQETTAVQGVIQAMGVKSWRQGTGNLFEIILSDGQDRLHCRWWNQPYLEKQFAVSQSLLVYGRISSVRPRTMDNPEFEPLEEAEAQIHLGRVVPVYPLTEGIRQRWLRSLIWHALADHAGSIESSWGDLRRQAEAVTGKPMPVSGALLAVLPDRREAIRQLHFPATLAAATTARQRLALEELLDLQVELRRRRQRLVAGAPGRACPSDNRLIKPFLARLGFKPTAAQVRVLREIRADLSHAVPMRRLLQGDVGAGKTLVAACAALMTIEAGVSVVIMAPTEILAEQHFRTFERWFQPLGVPVELRTASRRVEADVPAQEPRLRVGTHALLSAGAAPDNLGLVVIDEQHKFGVAQREALVRQGVYPHLLVMTATPIPRTLGLTVYGDLDVSVLDELPPGRGVIRTFVRGPEKLPQVWQFIREKLQAGRQAYVVYPRLEESDTAASIKAAAEELGVVSQAMAPFQVRLLHGRLPAEEKERIMREFAANQVQVLVATSVVEVGLDVPNACVLLVDGAERFGLAQLHQLRGRIGRGGHSSWCVLLARQMTVEARHRLRVLEETADGFRIAEEDLRLRGPGELLGQAQSGLPPFRFAELKTDHDLVVLAAWLATHALQP
jgi:ATP-dependent DNA helicase RecG